MRMVLVLLALCLNSAVRAEDSMIYISAFAPGEKGAIHAFRFDDSSGALSALHRTTDVQNPFFIAISPDERFLYSIDAEEFGGKDDEFVAAYVIEGNEGKLRRINRRSARGSASCYLDVDQTGKTVLVANYSTGSVAALPVEEGGQLGEAGSLIKHLGSSVDPNRQTGPYAHSIVVSPDNKFALAADLGIDKILIYRLNAEAALLAPNENQRSADLPAGSGPRHLVFHPNGRRVYVINELKNSVSFFDYVPAGGRLALRQTISTLPEDFNGKSHCADLKITPDGRFLYGTNRGHDSIAMFQIADDGTLSLIDIVPSRGKGPQNLLITPDGRWLLCANMPGDNVAVFAIDGESGRLSAKGEPVSMPRPSCIRLVPNRD